MSYHLAGHLGALQHAHGSRVALRRRIIPYFGGMGGYGGAGGLGNDAKKNRAKMSKAITLNELTASEVAKIHQVWAKYDQDFAAITGGKHGKTPAQAVAILGPYPEIEKIIGHALSPIVVAPPPGTGGSSTTDESSGTPWGLILGGAAALAVGYAVTRRG